MVFTSLECLSDLVRKCLGVQGVLLAIPILVYDDGELSEFVLASRLMFWSSGKGVLVEGCLV